jgi:putative transposase
MRAPFTQLYLHCVGATWDRLPLLTPDVEETVYAAVHAKCREMNCETHAIGVWSEWEHTFIPETTRPV